MLAKERKSFLCPGPFGLLFSFVFIFIFVFVFVFVFIFIAAILMTIIIILGDIFWFCVIGRRAVCALEAGDKEPSHAVCVGVDADAPVSLGEDAGVAAAVPGGEGGDEGVAALAAVEGELDDLLVLLAVDAARRVDDAPRAKAERVPEHLQLEVAQRAHALPLARALRRALALRAVQQPRPRAARVQKNLFCGVMGVFLCLCWCF